MLGLAHAAAWMLVAASALAQTAKPDAAAEAAAAAAMERAKRLAAGPMRIILEASKSRRKVAEAEPPAAAEAVARAAPAKLIAAAPTVAADGRLLVATSTTGDTSRAPARTAPAADAALPAEVAPVLTPPPAAPAPAPASTLVSEFLQSKQASAAVPALEAIATPRLAGSAMIQSAPMPAASLTVAAATGEAFRPRLVTMVEPELSQRLLDQLGRNAAVLIDLKLRADGSVAGITVLPPSSRLLERALAPTLEQWMFEPLPAARVHRVELVFNVER